MFLSGREILQRLVTEQITQYKSFIEKTIQVPEFAVQELLFWKVL